MEVLTGGRLSGAGLRPFLLFFLLQLMVIISLLQLDLPSISSPVVSQPTSRSADVKHNSVAVIERRDSSRSTATSTVHEGLVEVSQGRTRKKQTHSLGRGRNTGPNLSIIVACKDRGRFLKQALASWLLLSEVSEIVIVDWSSGYPLVSELEPELAAHADKIKLVTVVGEEHWVLSRAYNLAASLATGDVLIKCDSESLLNTSFISTHGLSSLPQSVFYRGYYSNASNENEIHLNGMRRCSTVNAMKWCTCH